MLKAGVHPIKDPHGGEAQVIVAELQRVLTGSPPPWLARVTGRASDLERFVVAEES